jgi:hypothetical protein
VFVDRADVVARLHGIGDAIRAIGHAVSLLDDRLAVARDQHGAGEAVGLRQLLQVWLECRRDLLAAHPCMNWQRRRLFFGDLDLHRGQLVRLLDLVIEPNRAACALRSAERHAHAAGTFTLDLFDFQQAKVAADAVVKRLTRLRAAALEKGLRVRLPRMFLELLGCAVERRNHSIEPASHRRRLRRQRCCRHHRRHHQ